jgi:hypothetical protein
VARALGAVLFVLGVIALLAGGIPYSRERQAVELGPARIWVEERKSLPVPPVAAAALVLAGVALVFWGAGDGSKRGGGTEAEPPGPQDGSRVGGPAGL